MIYLVPWGCGADRVGCYPPQSSGLSKGWFGWADNILRDQHNFKVEVDIVSFAAVFSVVTQRERREERCVTTLKTAARETKVDSTSLITSALTNQRVQKALFTCLVSIIGNQSI